MYIAASFAGDFVVGAIIAVAAVVAALIFDFLLFVLIRRAAKKSEQIPAEPLVIHCRLPLRFLLVLIAVRLVLPFLGVSQRAQDFLKHVLGMVLIGVVSWLVVSLVNVFADYVLGHFDIAVKDNLRARKVYTQLRVVKRITTVVVLLLAFGMMLMTFPAVRQVGTTILASAGIVGIVVGMAAQRTIGAFIAGLQIAITQPIRLDDVVIVENEWGRIEEIALTYVVVKVWDLRRLVVPITYFLEKPFQNWTRQTADLLGTIYIHVDYTIPIEEVRVELRKIAEQSKYWDGKVCGLQVTNASERAVELRAIVSAVDGPTAWNLRCEVREKLIIFIQKNYPESLPKTRAEFKELKS